MGKSVYNSCHMISLHLITVSKQTALNVVQTGRSWHQFRLWHLWFWFFQSWKWGGETRITLIKRKRILPQKKKILKYCLLLRCTSTARSSSLHIVNVSKINRVIWVAVVIVIVDRLQVIFWWAKENIITSGTKNRVTCGWCWGCSWAWTGGARCGAP